jgi:hypothetical protein
MPYMPCFTFTLLQRSLVRLSRHQMRHRRACVRIIGESVLHPHAFTNDGMFETAPLTRYRPSGCGFVATISRANSGVALPAHISANPRKNRCSGVKPSIFTGIGFPLNDFSSAAYAIVNPPRSAMLSPSTNLPFSCSPGSTSNSLNCFAMQSPRSWKFFKSSGVHQFLKFP